MTVCTIIQASDHDFRVHSNIMSDSKRPVCRLVMSTRKTPSEAFDYSGDIVFITHGLRPGKFPSSPRQSILEICHPVHIVANRAGQMFDHRDPLVKAYFRLVQYKGEYSARHVS